MAVVRSHTLGAGKFNANLGVALFTVPVNGVWVIKDLRVQNNTGSTGDFSCFIQRGAATITLLENVALANGAGMNLTGFVVLEAGDVFNIKNNVNATGFNVWVSGAKLS